MANILRGLILCLFVSPIAFGQTTSTPDEPRIKEELSKLFSDLNEAISKRDRAALERVYADEFQFVHTTGGVIKQLKSTTFLRTTDLRLVLFQFPRSKACSYTVTWRYFGRWKGEYQELISTQKKEGDGRLFRCKEPV